MAFFLHAINQSINQSIHRQTYFVTSETHLSLFYFFSSVRSTLSRSPVGINWRASRFDKEFSTTLKKTKERKRESEREREETMYIFIKNTCCCWRLVQFVAPWDIWNDLHCGCDSGSFVLFCLLWPSSSSSSSPMGKKTSNHQPALYYSLSAHCTPIRSDPIWSDTTRIALLPFSCQDSKPANQLIAN